MLLGPGAVTEQRRDETVSVSKYAGRAVENCPPLPDVGVDETSRDSARIIREDLTAASAVW